MLNVNAKLKAKLRDIIMYTISRFPYGVGRTRLMKVLFLVDAIAGKRLGKKITGLEWFRWHYGPFSPIVLDVLDKLVYEGFVEVDKGPEVRYKIIYELDEDKLNIDKEEREIIDRVVEEYGFLPLGELLNIVYEKYKIYDLEKGEVIPLTKAEKIVETILNYRDRDEVLDEILDEIVETIYEEYRKAFEMLPKSMLTLYILAAKRLAEDGKSKDLKSLTNELLCVLREVRDYVEEHERKSRPKPMPRELKKKVWTVYDWMSKLALDPSLEFS